MSAHSPASLTTTPTPLSSAVFPAPVAAVDPQGGNLARRRLRALARVALVVVCVTSGMWAAEETKKLSLDDSKAALEKLKVEGKIKQYKLDPGTEAGLLKLDLSTSGIIDLAPLKGMPLEWLHIDGNDHSPSMVVTLTGALKPGPPGWASCRSSTAKAWPT